MNLPRATFPVPDKEYLLFCDESEASGRLYSNFYGGVLVGSSQYERVSRALDAEKQRLNLFGEIKWSKVTLPYLEKYVALLEAFFAEVRAGHLRVRVMFRSNALGPLSLTPAEIDSAYFRLYYHFIKHAVGLLHRPASEGAAGLRLHFDEFPETHEAVTQFRGLLLGLKDNARIRRARLSLQLENIVEIRSHEHVLAQCLDVVLGAMAFHLNERHKEVQAGTGAQGKRTVAKETLFKAILAQVESLCPGFAAGVSTPTVNLAARWKAPYLHWSFTPAAPALVPANKTGPT